jgi:hypothetical protein
MFASWLKLQATAGGVSCDIRFKLNREINAGPTDPGN